MKDFFVSYNRADKVWAEWIAWQLEAAGFRCILQAWDFRPGRNFVLEMQKAAVEAEKILAVLSPNYLDALFTQPEWAAALAQDPTGEKRTLIPVRVRECELKGLLAQIIYIDLVGLSETEAREVMLRGLSPESRNKPQKPGGFPSNDSFGFPPQTKPSYSKKEEKVLSGRSEQNITVNGSVTGSVINQGTLSGNVNISTQIPENKSNTKSGE